MAQEATPLTTGTLKSANKVRPNEDTTVYMVGDAKGIIKAGTPKVVHRLLAEKLVAQGKATMEALSETTKQKRGQK